MGDLNQTVGPLVQLALLGSLVATVPLVWWRQRSRGATASQRLRALTLLTLFLTFDLIVFGAFTRLTDSGLGCPDWPGCYGQASPIAAHADIQAAQTAMPTGPVTHGKAWVEMIHRYLASAVGVLCIGLCLLSWHLRRSTLAAASPAPSPWWATLTLVWICVQGAFGALTVTMKLFPAIVSLHLLFGLGLLMLLAWQAEAYEPRPLAVPAGLRALVPIAFLLLLAQVALGGWVSTNYAVLACDEFPTCHGSAYWPTLDFANGFRLWRELGSDGAGGWIGFAALAAIHVAHRLGAVVVIFVLALLAGGLWRAGQPGWARLVVGLLLWQFLSGLSNAVLDWPLVAALAHSGGAGALLAVLVTLFARVRAGASASRS